MKDIIGAMEKEREYLSFRMKGEEPYHFADAVKEYGFESLKEYFDAKNDYQISEMSFNVVETTPDKAIDAVFTAISAQKNTVGFINIDYTLVLTGNLGDANKEYCDDCNIPIYPYYTNGGSSVATEGDFLLGICIKKINEFGTRHILRKIKGIFEKYSSRNFDVNGNDVLMDGTKILGSAVYDQNGMFVLINYLSFSDKQALIEKICLKHSTKQPGHIDFMTREDFKREVSEWLRVL